MTIGVLCGGLSREREVSLRTGEGVHQALVDGGYRAVLIDAGRDLPRQLADNSVDVAFIALHGRFGEDGTVQGLLEMLGVPYTGSGVLASALAIDKVATKKMLLYHELPTPGFLVLRRGEERTAVLEQCRHFPLVVKPSREGSTLGISIVRGAEELEEALDEALGLDDTVLIEDCIEGMEVTVSILDGEALPIIQIVPKGGFYDYHAKYTAGQTRYIVPAPLPAAVYRRLQEVSVETCRVLGVRGAARVDFMVREKEFYILEVNTIPGMTPTSLLPKAARQAGIDYRELVVRMLLDAGLDK
ncbi:MAG: D-alanine--D-alanine ligase [Deltaproteobacteria bacterium]|nr:MAG: D-alanine--D-alanine ligase [Deltaproteobacteria bacterium]